MGRGCEGRWVGRGEHGGRGGDGAGVGGGSKGPRIRHEQ